MRRKEFEGYSSEAGDILDRAEVGQLGLTDAEGWPRIIPVNFARDGGSIYFHGAGEGEKYTLLRDGAKVTFLAYLAFSIIPSYWRSKDYSCSATAFYKSVHIRGACSIVDSPQEKAAALNAIMEKYQPEGGYIKVSTDDPLYAKALQETVIFRVETEQVSVKSKLGQNLPPETRRYLVSRLLERDNGPDRVTAGEIEKTLG